MLFCAMYHKSRNPAATWEVIEESIEQAKLTGITHMFILGDLNDDVQKPRSKLLSVCNDCHLIQLITEPPMKTW